MDQGYRPTAAVLCIRRQKLGTLLIEDQRLGFDDINSSHVLEAVPYLASVAL